MRTNPTLATNSDVSMSARCTWNHSPLGRAGRIQAAKKMPVDARRGHAINMRIPCVLMRAFFTAANELGLTTPVAVVGLMVEDEMEGKGALLT